MVDKQSVSENCFKNMGGARRCWEEINLSALVLLTKFSEAKKNILTSWKTDQPFLIDVQLLSNYPYWDVTTA